MVEAPVLSHSLPLLIPERRRIHGNMNQCQVIRQFILQDRLDVVWRLLVSSDDIQHV